MRKKLLLCLLIIVCEECFSQNVNSSIVLVNSGLLNRKEIAKVITIINAFNPKVISIDLQFSKNTDYESDLALVKALWNSKKLVIGSVIDDFDYESGQDERDFKFTYGSLPEFVPFNAKTGFINAIPEDDEFLTVRRFSIKEKVEGEIEYHFAVQTAMEFDSAVAINFINGKPKIIDVDYKNGKNIFKKIAASKILKGQIPLDLIEGKIILLGYLGPGEVDKFYTAINKNPSKGPDMYGVEYLANIVVQVLDCK